LTAILERLDGDMKLVVSLERQIDNNELFALKKFSDNLACGHRFCFLCLLYWFAPLKYRRIYGHSSAYILCEIRIDPKIVYKKVFLYMNIVLFTIGLWISLFIEDYVCA